MDIQKSIESDIAPIASNLRLEDLKEIQANSGREPYQAVVNGFRSSKPSAYTLLDTYPTKALKRDAEYVGPRLREADRLEVQASVGGCPKAALQDAVENSEPEAYTCLDRGLPFGMFGVVPFSDNPRFGVIWLLGTDYLTDSVTVSFLRWSKRFLPTLIEPYDLVCNVVDKRNEVHIKWINWLGFSFIREIIYGPENRPFLEFAKVNHV